MRILISGASVAGPTLAYWLDRYGFTVTVVERSPTLRKTGGHAVDLFRPAMEIAERMGALERVQARQTHISRVGIRLETRPQKRHEMRVSRILGAYSDRHAEIMREDLSEILHDLSRDRVEYLFGDSIAALDERADGVEVSFEQGPPRRFDLVIGADGLHSNVRRLVFGPESQFAAWLGGYLAVIAVPNYLGLSDSSETIAGIGRIAAFYGVAHADGDDAGARALFLFRTPRELDYHYRDADRQKRLLREAYQEMGWEIPKLLGHLQDAPSFYFDSVTQLRLPSWSRGRVSLVGDAGYCPGPAVGGSTSLAMVGAYVLAGEIAVAGGDHTRAFPAYEEELGGYVRKSRQFAVGAMKRLVPGKQRDLTSLVVASHLVNRTPAAVIRLAAKLAGGTTRLHDSVPLKDYSMLVRAGQRG